MFDMTQCKIGDKLVTRDGTVAEFTALVAEFTVLIDSGQYPYLLSLPGGAWWTCTRDGRVYKNEDNHYDIVGFAPQVTREYPASSPVSTQQDSLQAIQQITIVAKPSFVLSFDGKDATLTLDELKALSVKIINLIGED